jgi:opacity protein-like surface antigen
MRKVIFAAAAASVMALAAMPAAAQDWYAQVNTGVSTGKADASAGLNDEGVSGDVDLKPGFLVGAAGGVALGNGLRLELEGLYDQNKLKHTDVKNMNATAFANVLYDFNVGGMTPYVGAGVGYSSTSLKQGGDSIHDQGTAWQLRAGVTVPVNEVLSVDIGYRYMDLGKFNATVTDGTDTVSLKLDPKVHALTVGARFKLGAGAK